MSEVVETLRELARAFSTNVGSERATALLLYEVIAKYEQEVKVIVDAAFGAALRACHGAGDLPPGALNPFAAAVAKARQDMAMLQGSTLLAALLKEG